MKAGEICNRIVAFATRDEEIREAARRMLRLHVGDLVVVDERDGDRIPVGILTDRDIVVGPLAEGEDLESLRVEDVMTRDLVTAEESDDLEDALRRMRSAGVRRLPVVDGTEALQGILTLDDALEFLNEELTDLVQLVAREQTREAERRKSPGKVEAALR